MRISHAFVAITLTTICVVEASASQQPAAKPVAKPAVTPSPAHAATAPRAASATTGMKPEATIKDLMGKIIDPASKIVFEAVSTDVVGGVETQKKPQNDQEWAIVQRNALILAEGANLMMVSGRHAAKPGQSAATGELPHDKIEALVNKDRASWNKYAKEFQVAAEAALAAAEAKDPEKLFAVGADIDMGCENCHLKYWYPDQDKLFTK